MIQKSKAGIHVENIVDFEEQKDFVEKAKPAIVLQIDDSPSFVRASKPLSPQTVWFGRVYSKHQSVDNPFDAATEWYDRIMRKAMLRDVDAWMGINEPSQWDHVRQAEFECYLADMLAAEEVPYACFSWSGGNPRLSIISESIYLEALKKSAYYSKHEYNVPTLWEIQAFDPPYVDKEAYLTNGWFTLRYRKDWEIICQHLVPEERPKVVLTEYGICSGITHWPISAQGGWKSFGTIQETIEQIAWFDRQMRMDDYVVGAAWFTFGSRSQHFWETYDFLYPVEARRALADYLISQQEEEPGGNEQLEQFIAGYLNDPDVMIPANPDAWFQQYARRHGLGSARSREEGYGGELVFQGHRYLAQMFIRDDDLLAQHVVYADLDDQSSWEAKTSHFDWPQ